MPCDVVMFHYATFCLVLHSNGIAASHRHYQASKADLTGVDLQSQLEAEDVARSGLLECFDMAK